MLIELKTVKIRCKTFIHIHINELNEYCKLKILREFLLHFKKNIKNIFLLAYKYREGNMKRTLKKGLKVYEPAGIGRF